ncbi:MAG: hypothetical protein S4CHLAM20_15330 [Chlamydiia bacterium]|nr:hypothetical protein [Chlamydiia bacterium]
MQSSQFSPNNYLQPHRPSESSSTPTSSKRRQPEPPHIVHLQDGPLPDFYQHVLHASIQRQIEEQKRLRSQPPPLNNFSITVQTQTQYPHFPTPHSYTQHQQHLPQQHQHQQPQHQHHLPQHQTQPQTQPQAQPQYHPQHAQPQQQSQYPQYFQIQTQPQSQPHTKYLQPQHPQTQTQYQPHLPRQHQPHTHAQYSQAQPQQQSQSHLPQQQPQHFPPHAQYPQPQHPQAQSQHNQLQPQHRSLSTRTTSKKKSSSTCIPKSFEEIIIQFLPTREDLDFITTFKNNLKRKGFCNGVAIKEIKEAIKTIPKITLENISSCHHSSISKMKARVRRLINNETRQLEKPKDSDNDKSTLTCHIESYFNLCIFETNHFKNQLDKIYGQNYDLRDRHKQFSRFIKELKERKQKCKQAIEDFSFTDKQFSQSSTYQPSTNQLQETEKDQLPTSSSAMTTSVSPSSTSIDKISKLIEIFKKSIETNTKRRATLKAVFRRAVKQRMPEISIETTNSFLQSCPKEYQRDLHINTRPLSYQCTALATRIFDGNRRDIIITSVLSYVKLRKLEWKKHILPKFQECGLTERASVGNYEKALTALENAGESLIKALNASEEEPS